MMSQALLLWRHAVISWAGSIFTLSQSLVYPTPLRPGKFSFPDSSSRPEFVCNGLSTLSEEAAAFIWAQISARIWIICCTLICISNSNSNCNKQEMRWRTAVDVLLAVRSRSLNHRYFSPPSNFFQKISIEWSTISSFQDAIVSWANDQANAGHLAIKQGGLPGQLPRRCPWRGHDRP